jgi:hypothetical protein
MSSLNIDALHVLTDQWEDCPGIPKVVNIETRQTYGPDIMVYSIAPESLRQALPRILADRTLTPEQDSLLEAFLRTKGSE